MADYYAHKSFPSKELATYDFCRVFGLAPWEIDDADSVEVQKWMAIHLARRDHYLQLLAEIQKNKADPFSAIAILLGCMVMNETTL